MPWRASSFRTQGRNLIGHRCFCRKFLCRLPARTCLIRDRTRGVVGNFARPGGGGERIADARTNAQERRNEIPIAKIDNGVLRAPRKTVGLRLAEPQSICKTPSSIGNVASREETSLEGDALWVALASWVATAVVPLRPLRGARYAWLKRRRRGVVDAVELTETKRFRSERVAKRHATRNQRQFFSIVSVPVIAGAAADVRSLRAAATSQS